MAMKLHFEPDLDFQLDAIEAVCGLFEGQETNRTEFTVTEQALDGDALPGMASDLGIGNRLTLLDDEILGNLQGIQLREGLPQSESLASGDFTVEMETGTGKTYVYLRTIFELNKRYGFTKFVIVVPSIAIKEGVYKTLEITRDHFKGLYAGTPYDYFLYDSRKLGQVRNFATSSQVQIMVVTVGAINKLDVNNLYKDSEKTGGERPIDLVKATLPVLIVDEPQSVDGGLGGRGKEALAEMNPLCTLRYSATHVDKHHMVYRLDAVDAYERKLVKQIEVASATIQDGFNQPFVRLLSVNGKSSPISAKVELHIEAKNGVRPEVKTVHDGDDLEQVTGRAVYADMIIGEINAKKDQEFVEIRMPGDERFLKIGEHVGDVDQFEVHRHMIRRTIQEHLQKEMRLRPKGIKVLSLFFIDQVARYRQYAEDGTAVKGRYAQIFEEEYQRMAKRPDFATLFEGADLDTIAEDVHDGYFSIDKKNTWVDTAENNQANRDDAERGYNLIMKEKEKLLSFDTPLKFIFSHSALREGWDNPNVFQICTLRDIRTERERRQTIGRGLRLAVNQDGERVRGFDINTLTVIATESYEDFADNLQKEIEQDTGIRFGVLESHQFAAIPVQRDDGTEHPLGADKSAELWEHFRSAEFIDEKGRVQDSLRIALRDETLELPDEFDGQADDVIAILKKVAGRLDIRDADERRQVGAKQAVLETPEFKELWSRIKQRTTYRVDFDNDKLVRDCVEAVKKAPPIVKTKIQWRKAGISIGQGGVEADETEVDGPTTIDPGDILLPDVLTELQDRTQLTRKTIHTIIADSGRLQQFRWNPQQFIEIFANEINRTKRKLIVDGIRYKPIGEDGYYAQELFESEELTGYVKNMLLDAEKSVYEAVIYDSHIEERFARDMEKNTAVKVYAKLPSWFRIPTPLGDYNPDWAVLVDVEDEERLYFVVETKGSTDQDSLRISEEEKIRCGRRHFEAISSEDAGVRYEFVSDLDELLKHAG
jgi:type III restriction enzyme